MRNKRRRCLMGTLMLSVFALMLTPEISDVAALPSSIEMRRGAELRLPVSTLMRAEVVSGDAVSMNKGEGLSITARDAGVTTLAYRLMGLWPVKTVNLSVEEERQLIPGGQSVGIAIQTAGVVVVGASDLGAVPSPARTAGIRSGDIIRKINGQSVDSAEALSKRITSGDRLSLEVFRSGRAMTCEVEPAMDVRDGAWRLGAWVRDSTAGVGTLTFVDPRTGLYGALGHAITDSDTHVTLPVGVGQLYKNNVVDVNPSRKGSPGELTGDFIFNTEAVGTVERNSARGIFGYAELDGQEDAFRGSLPVARRFEIHTGPAMLLTTVDESGINPYACEVVRINESDSDGKSMIIRITDQGLLKQTGGIVQGMSGSPIIQDGRLIGAVTHVMVNDPTRGYAICIDAMLDEAENLEARDNAA